MVLNVHRNRKAYYGRGEGVMEVGGEGKSVYSYKHIHILNALFNTGGKLRRKTGWQLTWADVWEKICLSKRMMREKKMMAFMIHKD